MAVRLWGSIAPMWISVTVIIGSACLCLASQPATGQSKRLKLCEALGFVSTFPALNLIHQPTIRSFVGTLACTHTDLYVGTCRKEFFSFPSAVVCYLPSNSHYNVCSSIRLLGVSPPENGDLCCLVSSQLLCGKKQCNLSKKYHMREKTLFVFINSASF